MEPSLWWNILHTFLFLTLGKYFSVLLWLHWPGKCGGWASPPAWARGWPPPCPWRRSVRGCWAAASPRSRSCSWCRGPGGWCVRPGTGRTATPGPPRRRRAAARRACSCTQRPGSWTWPAEETRLQEWGHVAPVLVTWQLSGLGIKMDGECCQRRQNQHNKISRVVFNWHLYTRPIGE